jgi:hypothetical protein
LNYFKVRKSDRCINIKQSFIPGLKLSKLFYSDIIKKKLEKEYPKLEYAAALIGQGSEVLGFDDEMSTDHHWGPRLQLFLKEEDYDKFNFSIRKYFSKNLPFTFLGYSTNWSEPNEKDGMNQFLELKKDGPINHRIEIYTVQRFLKLNLGLESLNLNESDWFTIPEQRLLEFTSGKVFYDNFGELTYARKILNYYPDSIWKLKIIVQWDRISQEMAFVGRIGGKGDDLGSRIEASRLVRYIMEMAFILEKKYIPYEKWFSIAFKKLLIAKALEPLLLNILKENYWHQRERLLCDAYLQLIHKHIELKLIPKIKIEPTQFYNRPQLVIPLQEVIEELKKGNKYCFSQVSYSLGTINQFIDISNNLNPQLCRRAQLFYKSNTKKNKIK